MRPQLLRVLQRRMPGDVQLRFGLRRWGILLPTAVLRVQRFVQLRYRLNVRPHVRPVQLRQRRILRTWPHLQHNHAHLRLTFGSRASGQPAGGQAPTQRALQQRHRRSSSSHGNPRRRASQARQRQRTTGGTPRQAQPGSPLGPGMRT